MAAEYQKFDAKILAADIAGRVEALNLERAYIDAFFEKFGRNPSANKFPRRKS
ncbi:MAG: hypothetical protein J0L99_10600 [Chitinophagales bacterium]|nr:hypothetical protein [Chitinophagales bacterium]